MPAVVESYKPGGKMGTSAPLLLAAALVAGPLVGVIYHFVARWMNFLLISQVLAGFLVGGAIALAVKNGKCRNPRAAILAAVLGSLLCFTTFLALNSQRAKPYLMLIELGSQTTYNAQTFTNIEKSMTPLRTLELYLQENATSGVRLRDSHSYSSTSSSGTTIKGAWYWGLLALEIGLVVLTASALAQSTASARFCERCEVWWNTLLLHRSHVDDAAGMVARAQERDWSNLRQVSSPKKPTDKIYCKAEMKRCPQCSEATITIQAANGGTPKTVYESALQPQEAKLLGG